LPEPYRAAVYYAPEADDPLWPAGCAWLGRNPETGEDFAAPYPDLTTDPRRYGFHATLKAPMLLRHGLAAFVQDAAHLAARSTAFDLAPLAVTDLRGFLALCYESCRAMDGLAAECVLALDHHRVPEDKAVQAQRAAGRTPRQAANIELWGYPYVLEDFLFHMTLTNCLEPNPLTATAEAYFAPALALPRRVASLAVFVEDTRGAPFRLSHRLPFPPT
jgi:hypothetical protein